MNAGLPGTGIGGLFYLAGALWMPVHGLARTLRGEGSRVDWRRIATQSGMAVGILAALWLTGWLLGALVALAPVTPPWGAPGGVARRLESTESLVRWTAVVGTTGVLAFVLAAVQALRLVLPRRPCAISRDAVAAVSPPAERAWPSVRPVTRRSHERCGLAPGDPPAHPLRTGGPGGG